MLQWNQDGGAHCYTARGQLPERLGVVWISSGWRGGYAKQTGEEDGKSRSSEGLRHPLSPVCLLRFLQVDIAAKWLELPDGSQHTVTAAAFSLQV